ncbi:MAG TPA: D-alanyl-D-alanine carboxypeptidase family protein [Blastocatellia bacterium]|nr:D-alanyl-D-alanine carboxypeptidase family protein [Blastocatellia bacterium]
MPRPSLGVCTTIALSFFLFANSCLANTSRKSAQPNSSSACGSCAAVSNKSNGGRALKKSVKTASKTPCHPKDYLDPKVAANYKTAVRQMKREGIKPKVTSVWRSTDYQGQLHKCSTSTRCRREHPGLYYALPPGNSLHEAGFAVDISGVAAGPRGRKRLTSQGHRIVSIMRKNGFNWRYQLADPAHFEADPKRHGYRSAKQAIAHTQTTCTVKLAKLAKVTNHTSQKKTGAKVSVDRSRPSAKTQLSARGPAAKLPRHSVKARA